LALSPPKEPALAQPSATSPRPAPAAQATDQELLRALAAGDPDAFDTLFQRHGAAVLGFLSRLTAQRVDPEDLLQETFLRVLTHAKDFREDAPFRPWLYTIARNVAFNALKKSKRRSEWEAPVDLADWEFPLEARKSGGDPPPSPLDRAERNEEQARVLAALEELPAPHREILVLVLFEGFSYEEASRITGDPEGTLRSRVFHGLKKLRDRLKETP
jgi:RNA polymerase sigma-70 factor (ECF subfamily)